MTFVSPTLPLGGIFVRFFREKKQKKCRGGQKKARFACAWPDHAKRASSNFDNDKESMKSYGAVGAISIGEGLLITELALCGDYEYL